MKHLIGLLAGCGALALTAHARADVSSWAYVGSGVSAFEQRGVELKAAPTLAIETGIGTAPSRRWILGGMVKSQTFFGSGTDLALALRVASQGFVTGRFGLALDAGAYHRGWGVGSNGGQAALVFGAPWGLTLSLGGGVGSHDARHFGATLGVDFARLTVYRLSGESWFPNPHPAYRPKD